MNFEEKLRARFSEVMDEQSTFAREWGNKRREIVEPRMRLAEKVLKERLGGGVLLDPKNGEITLFALHEGQENFLAFSSDTERLEVKCSMASYPKDSKRENAPAEEKLMALAEITQPIIEEIVMGFAVKVARGKRQVREAAQPGA